MPRCSACTAISAIGRVRQEDHIWTQPGCTQKSTNQNKHRNTQKLTRANVYKSFAFPPRRTIRISFDMTKILNGILKTPHLKRAKHMTSLNWSPKFALYFCINSHLGSPEAWKLQVRGLRLLIPPSTFPMPTASAEARWVGMVLVTGWQSPYEQRRALHTVAWGTFGGFQFFPVSTPLPWYKNHPLLGFPGIPEKGRKYCLCPPPQTITLSQNFRKSTGRGAKWLWVYAIYRGMQNLQRPSRNFGGTFWNRPADFLDR